MKHWKCSCCSTEKETKEDVIISICPCCCNSMFEIKKEESKNGGSE